MECHVITAILNGEQRVREEDYLRRQLERDYGVPQSMRKPRWQALIALLGRKREHSEYTPTSSTTGDVFATTV